MILRKSGTGRKDLVKMVQMGKVGTNDTLMSRFPTPQTPPSQTSSTNINFQTLILKMCHFYLFIFTSAMFYLCQLWQKPDIIESLAFL